MTLASDAAKAMALDACYGDNHGANWPELLLLAMFVGNPASGGVELDDTGGYARVGLANTSVNFPDADVITGNKTVSNVRFPTSTGAWSADADYWCLLDSTGTTLLDSGRIVDADYNPSVMSVTTAGRVPVLTFVIAT